MSFNKSILAFDDIRETFDRALASPKGLAIECGTRGAAMQLRSRFNYYRQLNRKETRDIYEPTHQLHGRSIYDRLVLRVPKRGSPKEATLYIEHHNLDDFHIEEIS